MMRRQTTFFFFFLIIVLAGNAQVQKQALSMTPAETALTNEIHALQNRAALEKHEGRNLSAFNYYLTATRLLPAASSCSPEFLEFAFDAEMNVITFVDTLMMEFRNSGSRITLSRFVFPVYEHAISIACRMYAHSRDKAYFDQAFVLAEKSKNLRVVEALRNSDAVAKAGIPDALANQFTRLSSQLEKCRLRAEGLKSNARKRDELVRINDTLALLQQKYDSLTFYIYTKYPSYFGLLNRHDFTGADNVRKEIIGDSSALLEYFFGDSTLYIFVVSRAQETILRIARKDCPDSLFLSFQQAIIMHDIKKFFSTSSRICDLVFKPAELALDNISRIIVIPDGLLSYVPFQCLIRTTPRQKCSNYKQLDYLVNHFSFSYSTSATALMLNMRLKPDRNGADLNFIAPVYDKDMKRQMRAAPTKPADTVFLGLTEQRWSRELADVLSKQFKGAYYIGDKADLDAFNKGIAAPGILHIAAHTLFDETDPMNSRIIFYWKVDKDSVMNNGSLYACDLFNKRVNASLVVLASCRTGFGTFHRCEGVSGLSYGFSYAGCPSLIFTLWEVDEKATNMLMLDFYNGLQRGESVDRALRNAQLAYLDKANESSADPYYWAGVIASGDCRPFASAAAQDDISKRLVFISIVLMFAILLPLFIIFRRRERMKSKRFS